MEWDDAFRQAGFRNALDVRVAPTEDEDPEFSLLDARFKRHSLCRHAGAFCQCWWAMLSTRAQVKSFVGI